MIDQSRSPAANAEQRRHTARHKMFGPVTLRVGSAEMRGHFLDLSSSGALAHCETPPVAGAYIFVSALGMEASGRVMWARGKRFGIQFSQPLSEEAVEKLISGA
ncbi:PilZ domain-containing protein [Sphingobium sp. EP60837]|uniref:PilZ domain-containing protein n=1 Tax=Sphingobium sp. EP60837 TaxID=1855519 RepID=UPI0007DDBEC4|nr:PilZ domain-containing protein [Sphingobium sp. EP60837]ANI78299.1 hypothetical protein EP837_01887 [Sphingobium sp. EP60837]